MHVHNVSCRRTHADECWLTGASGCKINVLNAMITGWRSEEKEGFGNRCR